MYFVTGSQDYPSSHPRVHFLLGPGPLTAVAESIRSALSPLIWQGAFVPVCPLALMHISASPMPSILGITKEVLLAGGAAEAHLQPRVYVADLEQGTISSQEAHPISLHVLPVDLGAKLLAAVSEAVASKRERKREKQSELIDRDDTGAAVAVATDADAAADSLSAAFYAFLVDMIGPFVGPKLDFDRERCLRTVDRSTALFMERLTRTQSWSELLEKKGSLKRLRRSWLSRRWSKNGVQPSA